MRKNDEFGDDRIKEIKEIITAKSLNFIKIKKNDKYAIELEKEIEEIKNYLKKYLFLSK